MLTINTKAIVGRVRQVGQVGQVGRGENCELGTSCKLAPAGLITLFFVVLLFIRNFAA